MFLNALIKLTTIFLCFKKIWEKTHLISFVKKLLYLQSVFARLVFVSTGESYHTLSIQKNVYFQKIRSAKNVVFIKKSFRKAAPFSFYLKIFFFH